MQLLDLVILAIATWRLAFFVVYETGPFAFMSRLRSKHDLGGLLTCIKCASVWSAIIMLLLYFSPVTFIVWLFSISGLALMLSSYTGAGAAHD